MLYRGPSSRTATDSQKTVCRNNGASRRLDSLPQSFLEWIALNLINQNHQIMVLLVELKTSKPWLLWRSSIVQPFQQSWWIATTRSFRVILISGFCRDHAYVHNQRFRSAVKDDWGKRLTWTNPSLRVLGCAKQPMSSNLLMFPCSNQQLWCIDVDL